jgi:hypothetical protein
LEAGEVWRRALQRLYPLEVVRSKAEEVKWKKSLVRKSALVAASTKTRMTFTRKSPERMVVLLNVRAASSIVQ